jgi:tetratricopeptide (TPR) repeat protein
MTVRLSRLHVVLAIILAIGALSAVAAWSALHGSDSEGLASQISRRVASLHVKPGTVELTARKALRVRNAVVAADFATAERITADVLAHSQLQNWRYYPFDAFIDSVTYETAPEFGRRLSEWIAKNSTDPIPLLLRAQYHVETGWTKRGHDFAANTSSERMNAFAEHMTKALADINAAIRLDNRNPYSFWLKLRILQGNGLSQGFLAAFDDAIKTHPAYYRLYDISLSTLQPRWGGTIAAMYAFVDKYAGNAPQFSPLKLLYLDLYRYLLSTASVGCGARGGDREKCVVAVMQKVVTPALEQHVVAALQLYDHTDRYQFGLAVKRTVSSMLATSGGDTYAGAILELAASNMHSDTQLSEDKPGSPGNYVIDELVAESWHHKGFYQNEIVKYKEALIHARSQLFPSEEEKSSAIAYVFEKLSAAADKQHQLVDMIAFEKTAVALGLPWDQHYICYAYYKLKHYAEAVRACTDAINSTGNSVAWYWRGVAYRDSGKPGDAIRDLTKVADSDGYFAASAAIDLSMIYFNHHQNQGALRVLNKYVFLYDPNRTTRSDVAVSYNNRCYAYMQLGELQKALSDCTQSLKYGSIPDAFRKQQELVKRLGAHEKGP